MLKGEEAGGGEGFEEEAGAQGPKVGCTRARGSAGAGGVYPCGQKELGCDASVAE